MKRTITTVYVFGVILVLAALVGWVAFSAFRDRSENLRNIKNSLDLYNARFEGIPLSERGVPTKELRDQVNRLSADEGRLDALVLYTSRDGIFFKASYSDNRSIDAQINALPARLTAPSIKHNDLFFVTKTGEAVDTDGSKVHILYIFESLGRAEIVSYLTMALIVVLALAVLTIVMIIITSRMGEGEARPAAASSRGLHSAPPKAPPIKREIRRAPDSKMAQAADDDFDLNLDDDFGTADQAAGDDINLDMDDDFGTGDMGDGLGDDFRLPGDDFDLPDVSLDALDEETEAEDKALKKKIPDIPEEEDLRAADHDRKEPESFELEEDLELPTLEDFSAEDLEDIDLGPSDGSLDDPGEDPSSKSLYSPRSGFCWESFLPERLKNELDRATSDNEDLLLVLFQDGSINQDQAYADMAGLIREEFPHNDLNFEYTDNGFAVILQDTEMETGITRLENLLKKWSEMNEIRSVRVGISARCGRLVDAGRLVSEAESSLSKASDENPIVGFRPDPEKFRQFISKKG